MLLLILLAHGYRLLIATPHADLLGVTDTGTRTVTLYEHPGEPPALLRKVLAYETAHVLDVDCLTSTQRHRWQHLRHLSGRWYAPNYADERGYGSGDFADIYSAWAIRSSAYFRDRPIAGRDLVSLAARFHFTRGVCP